jgi:imidazolonepropionase-like amidohydrolase
VTTYRGGRWYDGESFAARDVAVENGVFVDVPRDGDVVDLDGGWVVPPYGDAHVHWLEPALAPAYVAQHVRDGVLHVKDHATAPAFREAIRPHLGPVDYVSANAGFTAPAGHPIPLGRRLASLGVVPETWAETGGAGDFVHAVATPEDVARAWPLLAASRPDFVKVFLAHGALDPALLPAIVGRAHAAGLRVSAHAESADDVAAAVAGGIDDLAHLPFAEPRRIADDDVRTLGARGATVATTVEWLAESPEHVGVTRDNVTRLRAAGATVVVGTDLFRTTARDEALRLVALGLFTPAELLRAWCVDTPRAILPGRDVGRLGSGAEASFLVLRSDPLADVAATGDIALRVKRGRIVEPGDATLPPLG